MKKQALFLLAGGLLTFAACTNDQAPAGGYTQEQVDSAVEARLAEMQAQMQASNDSTINVLAQWKADSMIAAAKGGNTSKTTTTKSTPTKSTTTTTTTTTTPTPKAPDRPGATNNGVKTVGDRQGATNSNEPKKVNERPGATNNR